MIVILILIIIILIIIIVGFIYIKTSVERFSQKWFGTRDFFEGINKQKMQLEETPKTPYGIDSLIMPEIQRDFPNMNINEMKKIAENSILQVFKGINNKNSKLLKNANEKMLSDMQQHIASLDSSDLKIDNVKIHKTVINRYDREKSVCRLVFQTAVGYRVSKNKEITKIEDRINTEFIYVYNYENIKTHESISLKCPNCGAPIQSLGEKVCMYCKSGIIDLATKTWKLNDIKRA